MLKKRMAEIIAEQDKAITLQGDEIQHLMCLNRAHVAKFEAQSHSNARKDDQIRSLINQVNSLTEAAIRHEESVCHGEGMRML